MTFVYFFCRLWVVLVGEAKGGGGWCGMGDRALLLECCMICHFFLLFLVVFEHFGREARGEGGTETGRSTFAGLLSFICDLFVVF